MFSLSSNFISGQEIIQPDKTKIGKYEYEIYLKDFYSYEIDESGIKGIFSMVSPKNSLWTSGHADCLQSSGTCVNNCHFFDGDIEYIDIWELN